MTTPYNNQFQLNFGLQPEGLMSLPNSAMGAGPQMSPVSQQMMPQQFNPSMYNTGAPAATGGVDWGSMETWMGGKDSAGIVPTGIGAFNVGMNAWLGMEQLDLAKENMAFQKEAFNKNYTNQVSLLNTQMEDRQRAMYKSNPNAYEDPDSYMDRNRLDGDKK